MIQCLARFHPIPIRFSVSRIVSSLTNAAVSPSAKLVSAASCNVHILVSWPYLRGLWCNSSFNFSAFSPGKAVRVLCGRREPSFNTANPLSLNPLITYRTVSSSHPNVRDMAIVWSPRSLAKRIGSVSIRTYRLCAISLSIVYVRLLLVFVQILVPSCAHLYHASEILFWLCTSAFLGAKSNSVTATYISALEYFQQIGLSEWPDERFCLLIERLLCPEIQSTEFQQRLLTVFTDLLVADGFTIIQSDYQGGLPVYKVTRKEKGVIGSPKYLIFGSSGNKPDIVIDDAVNMDIRIVRYADQCLVYDQPPPHGDLTWQMLLEWWGEKNNVDPRDDKVRQEFGFRLRESLQSEPEKLLFDTYFKYFRRKYGKNLPALLPQVYLHYDPRHRNERDKPVLVRQRMDFLILLRNSVRVVLEIDGKQHYADDEGLASPPRYAEMVTEDRRMRLLGYEIFRFGGAEFVSSENGIKMITKFISELFLRYEIKPDHGD